MQIFNLLSVFQWTPSNSKCALGARASHHTPPMASPWVLSIIIIHNCCLSGLYPITSPYATLFYFPMYWRANIAFCFSPRPDICQVLPYWTGVWPIGIHLLLCICVSCSLDPSQFPGNFKQDYKKKSIF